VRGEPGLLRASRVAGIAVLVHAAVVVAMAVESAAIRPGVDAAGSDAIPSVGLIALTTALDLVRAAALVVLAVAVLRGRLLEQPPASRSRRWRPRRGPTRCSARSPDC
jgi:hypothetical protein